MLMLLFISDTKRPRQSLRFADDDDDADRAGEAADAPGTAVLIGLAGSQR